MSYTCVIHSGNLSECVLHQSYQSLSHYRHLHTTLSSEFLLICTHQGLLHELHPNQFLANNVVNKHITFVRTFFKEYSTSFLMVCRLIDFALVVLKLLMFKVCVIIGISKIEFFNLCGTERVKKNQKLKTYSKPPKLVVQSLFNQSEQVPNILFGFLLKL